MKREISAGGIVFKKIDPPTGGLNSKIENLAWLICQHSLHKGWVFPKGLVGDTNVGEKLEDAALREVEEEGGVKAKIITKLVQPIEYIYEFNGEKIHKTVHYFLMEYISGDPANHDHEMDEAKFVREDEVKKTLTYENDKKAFDEALQLHTQNMGV